MLEALRGRGSRLTRADAVVASGLPEDEADRALTVLLKEYRSHLSATESGELLYEFDPTFARRDAVTWRERGAALGHRLWKAFTLLFKVAIVATLIGYFALFVAMLVAMVFARSSSDRDDDGGIGLGGLFWFWGWDAGAGGYGRRPSRFALRAARTPFYKRVFAFVFGPPAPPVDPLQREKEIVAYIRAQRGRVAAVDFVRLMGWSFPRAEEEATRLMVDYGGEPEVSEEGVVVYTFKAVRRTAGDASLAELPAPSRSASDRLETTPPLTGNEPGTDLMIGAFNGFNLLAPFWIVPAFESRLHVSLASWHFLLTDFPLVFSALFIAIPAGRWLRSRVEARRRRVRNDRRRLLDRIFAGAGPRPREALAPTPEMGALLDRELVALGGDIAPEPDALGRVLYTFPRIDEELGAVARARAAAPVVERDAGPVVFSSAD